MYFIYGDEETDYLKRKDKVLAQVIDKTGYIDHEADSDMFSSVCHYIIGQLPQEQYRE